MPSGLLNVKLPNNILRGLHAEQILAREHAYKHYLCIKADQLKQSESNCSTNNSSRNEPISNPSTDILLDSAQTGKE